MYKRQGITISKGIGSDKPHITLSWSQVEKRIGDLIRMDRYLNPKEKEQYPESVSYTHLTKEYVCDDDWTIREITPSEGYLLDTTIHKVGAEPQLYTCLLYTSRCV